ncbi:MAG: 2-amino-4-hydroxy-6-hydroxymethyldihydropteridine diphosphokinase [Anaerolineae bacterium]|nr:2-amino-4-hydroxy-6-hydroxymethyldihydropteridine diphosphokinase [Anaerolineae bacterium]
MSLTYIALGSNLKDRFANLQKAIGFLSKTLKDLRASEVYETVPWGYLDQPMYLNQVIEAQTDLSPHDLHQLLKDIEIAMGREPTFKYGPRIIDLDILFYDDIVLDTPDLTIPHPQMSARAFVLVPLATLAPNLRHPVSGLTITQMLSNVDTSGVTKL